MRKGRSGTPLLFQETVNSLLLMGRKPEAADTIRVLTAGTCSVCWHTGSQPIDQARERGLCGQMEANGDPGLHLLAP